MKNFWRIVLHEYKVFWNDAGAKIIMVLGVCVYSLFYSIPYSTEIVRDVPIAVINEDHSALSRKFIRDLDASDSIKVVSQKANIEETKDNFYKDKIKAFVIIPKGYERDVLRGRPTNIEFYADSSYLIIYKAVYAGMMQVAAANEAQIEIQKLMKTGMSKEMAISKKMPFEYIQVPLYNPQGGYATYIYPLILIMILHQTLVVGLGLIQGTRNERNETYTQKKEDKIAFVLFARCTAYVILYLFYSYFQFLLFPVLFNYPMSYNLVGLILILIPMYYAAAFFSYAVSYFFTKRESALLIMVVTSLIFVFLPGIIWPKESIPMFINIIANFIPATPAIDALIKINQINTGFWAVRYDFLMLLALCFIYFKLAVKGLTKRQNDKTSA